MIYYLSRTDRHNGKRFIARGVGDTHEVRNVIREHVVGERGDMSD